MKPKGMYLFLTGGLLLLAIGSGFAMQQQYSHTRSALQALEVARLQLEKAPPSNRSDSYDRVQLLIEQAILEMRTTENSVPMSRSGRPG